MSKIRRPDLEAAPVKYPDYIGANLFPFLPKAQQGGTMYGPLRLWNGVGDYDMSTVISSNGVSFWKFMPTWTLPSALFALSAG